ncbi:MAG: transcription elongation factor GreA [Rickettsiales bacterium]|nr:transcription elongation factor GreA [Rickettsiales bacterium]|tara:strand:- start:3417 stop:3890 length:474 start_codon:yes stop_codon:yes gene_type:complete
MKKIPITKQGLIAIKAELDNLKGTERPLIIEAIQEARAHGDLSENAEYHAAREKQGYIEARIRDLEAKIGRAEVVDVASLSGDKVVFGATVTIVDEDTDEEIVYQIVGEEESDIKNGKLSIQAPLSRALVGKSVGDSIEVKTPSGTKFYEVLKVEFI